MPNRRQFLRTLTLAPLAPLAIVAAPLLARVKAKPTTIVGIDPGAEIRREGWITVSTPTGNDHWIYQRWVADIHAQVVRDIGIPEGHWR